MNAFTPIAWEPPYKHQTQHMDALDHHCAECGGMPANFNVRLVGDKWGWFCETHAKPIIQGAAA